MEFRPLTASEYETYLETAVSSYGNELFTAGMLDEEKAQIEAQAAYKNLLPEGIGTKDHYLYHAYDQDALVGFIWFGIRENNHAFIFDFYIEESMRRMGYGRQVMLACEQKAKELGAKTIGLHVFGHNKAARALYESLGYVPISIQMKKELK